MTHDSFAVSKPVLAAFEQQTGYDVKVLKSGDAGEAVNKAILVQDHPVADAFFGVDNTFLTSALDANLFEPYTAKGLDGVPADAPGRPGAPGHADRQRRRVRQRRPGVVRA